MKPNDRRKPILVARYLFAAALLSHGLPAAAQERLQPVPELTVARVDGTNATFLVHTTDADALQAVIFDESNLAVEGEDGGAPPLARLGAGMWTFSVPVDAATVHYARLVLRDGTITEVIIDGEDLEAHPGQQTGVRAQDDRNRTQWKAWVSKQTLRLLAKSLRSSAFRTVLNKARPFGGKQVIDAIERYRFQIADRLDVLTRYTDVVAQTVEDQVYNLLVNMGVGATLARQVGFVIKQLVL